MKKLACWKAKWISMAGRLTLITSVLSALPAYQLMAILHPKWLHKQLDKLRRAFLWAASDKVTGSKYLVNWTTVCLPKKLGGLSIPNLEMQSAALRVRWLWQQATDRTKPWIGLSLPVDNRVTEIFQASTSIQINSGRSTLFWTSHWLLGVPLCTSYPALYKHSRRHDISVREALSDRGWIASIKRDPTRQVLHDYLSLWELLERHAPSSFSDEDDAISWRWTSNRLYSASSAYHMQLVGRIPSYVFPQIWKAKATPKCRLHAWILMHNKCLTADNLEKRGWPHNPICRLCFVHPETSSC
jgi:hypothetical protein